MVQSIGGFGLCGEIDRMVTERERERQGADAPTVEDGIGHGDILNH